MLDLDLDLVLLLELEEVVTDRLLEQLRGLELELALELELGLGLGQLRGLEPELGPGPQELVGLLVELQGLEWIHRHTGPKSKSEYWRRESAAKRVTRFAYVSGLVMGWAFPILTLRPVFRCKLADLGRPYSSRREKEVSTCSPSRSWYLPPTIVVMQWVA